MSIICIETDKEKQPCVLLNVFLKPKRLKSSRSEIQRMASLVSQGDLGLIERLESLTVEATDEVFKRCNVPEKVIKGTMKKEAAKKNLLVTLGYAGVLDR